MALAQVAIIGRPNVGKSSLLNALAGQMISIVEPHPGVTRDRVSVIIEYRQRYFDLVDTGGYGIVDVENLSGHIESQILQAITSADVIVFMVDIRDGVVPLDETIARLLRRHSIEVIGVANKADSARMFPAAAEFSKLGFGEFLCISALNNLNKNELLDRILEKTSHLDSEKPAEPLMKIAIVGKRNAGKSTLLNAIVGCERVIVSPTPGTTRDAVDVRFEKDGRTIVVIDTAGVRKTSSIADSVEFYSHARVKQAIHRADIILLMIDAAVPISQVDKKLARLIDDRNKICIIVVNKWDLAKGSAGTADYEQYLTKTLAALKSAPIAFTTATQAKNIQSVLDLAGELFKQAATQIPTARLNKAFEVIKTEQLGAKQTAGKGRPKIYYATQIAANPITILIFVNNPELFDHKYRQYIIARLKSLLPIQEVPVRLLARPRTRPNHS